MTVVVFVTSILSGCETPTLLADSEGKIWVFKTTCLRKLFCIPNLEHKTNDWVQSEVNIPVGSWEPLLATVKDGNLHWFGHATCQHSLTKSILQGTSEDG